MFFFFIYSLKSNQKRGSGEGERDKERRRMLLVCTNHVVPSPNYYDVEELVKHADQSRKDIDPGII